MSKRDSHPGNQQSPALTGMGDRTEPGSPPDATPQYVRPARRSSPPADPAADPAADLAASLLKDLARTSLPAEGVPETSGQNAAAYAVSARRPPRAQEDKTLEPAVVVNMTEPFPMALPLPSPPPSAPRDAVTLVMDPRRATDPNDPRARKTMPAMRMAQAVPPPSMTPMPPTPLPLTPRPLQKTVLGPRQQRRQVMLGILSVIGIATLVAIGILAFAPRGRSRASSAATSELTAASTEGLTVTTGAAPPISPAVPIAVAVSAPAEPLPTAPPPPPAAPPPPPPPSPPSPLAATTPRATARVAPSNRPAPSPKPATPKPASTFEEPDRTF